MPFPEIDHQTWKTRLIKELKSQTWEGLQWQVANNVELEPLYSQEYISELGYLDHFHETWKSHKTNLKPTFIALADGLTAEEIALAENYGQSHWFSNKPLPTSNLKLPVWSRNETASDFGKNYFQEYDPFFTHLSFGSQPKSDLLKSEDIHIHTVDIHQAGGSPVQELAAALVAAAFYSEKFTDSNWMTNTTIHLGAGPAFWTDLCKFRAMRLLWVNFCHINGVENQIGKIRAHSSTLFWSKTDSDINLLRHSVGAVAAILGGADELQIYPHRMVGGKQLESCRLAIDIGHLALEEAHLNDFIDPAAGSYQADMLTHSLANEAWKLFNDWLDLGMENLMQNQVIQNSVMQNAKKISQDFADGKIPMVGVNLFPSDFARTSDSLPSLLPVENSLLPALFLDA